MTDTNTTYSKKELKAYILIYCAHADFSITKEETDFIRSIVDIDNFDLIKRNVIENSDYGSIQKILELTKKFCYSKHEKKILFREIKQLFITDGKYNILEKNLFRGLNHLLN